MHWLTFLFAIPLERSDLLPFQVWLGISIIPAKESFLPLLLSSTGLLCGIYHPLSLFVQSNLPSKKSLLSNSSIPVTALSPVGTGTSACGIWNPLFGLWLPFITGSDRTRTGGISSELCLLILFGSANHRREPGRTASNRLKIGVGRFNSDL